MRGSRLFSARVFVSLLIISLLTNLGSPVQAATGLAGRPGRSHADFINYDLKGEDEVLAVIGLLAPPEAVDDNYTTNEDTALTTENVLDNDSDPDGDAFAVQSFNATGTLGQVSVNTNGTFSYNPNGQFENLAVGESTTDSFTYTITDTTAATATATVAITITGVNDPPDAINDSGAGYTTSENASFTTGNVLANDTDPDTSDTLSVQSINPTGTKGLVTNNNNGTFGYNPNGQFENLAVGQSTTDTFTYTASDGHGGTDTATVTITITGVNDPPDAINDSGAGYTTSENASFTTGNVLANDTDPDTSDTLSVQSINPTGTKGLVTNNNNGTFGYNPNGQFENLAVGQSTTDTFTYTASDGHGGTDTATVTITITGVNDPPDANNDSGAAYTTNEDTAFTTGNVLANDTDPDGDTLSVQSINPTGTKGQVTNNNNGTFDYDPNGQFESLAQGESDTDTFTYTVSDGHGGTDTATVTITINGRNDTPTDLSLSNNTVNENQAAGLTVGTFSTADPDTSNTHTYALVSGTGDDDNGLFDIAGNTLKTDAVLDAIDSPYSIRVRTTDNNGASREEQFQIFVNDLQPTITVDKTATPGSVPETGANVNFAIKVTNTSQEKAVINIFNDTDFDLSTLCPDAIGKLLNPGQQYTCSFTKFISGDFGGPNHQNTATAIVGDNESNAKISSDSATVTLTDVLPDITVSVSANPTVVIEPGDNVTFTVKVTNNATEAARLTSLTNTKFSNLNNQGTCVANGTVTIPPNGGSYSCSFTKFLAGNFGDPAHESTTTAVVSDDDSNTLSKQANTRISFTKLDIKFVYLPLITVPMTELFVFNDNTGGDATVIVRDIATNQEVTRCIVPNGATIPCDHDGDGSNIFPPGSYKVEVTASCGFASAIKTYEAIPVITRVHCL